MDGADRFMLYAAVATLVLILAGLAVALLAG